MLRRSGLALILCATAALADPRLEPLGTLDLGRGNPALRGLSGIELSADGLGALLLSDRGEVLQAALTRRDGRLTGLSVTPRPDLGFPGQDVEGLAAAPDGTLYFSFESPARVAVRAPGQAAPRSLPFHRRFWALNRNRGLEALAIGDDGALYTIPELPWREQNDYLPLFRFDGARWTRHADLDFDRVFHPVGMDMGPDGWLYLLERAVTGLGFRSRIRRFRPEDPAATLETLLTTTPGRHDNLEAIAAWRDAQGHVRLTLASDDNFMRIQRATLVEYRLTEPLAHSAAQE